VYACFVRLLFLARYDIPFWSLGAQQKLVDSGGGKDEWLTAAVDSGGGRGGFMVWVRSGPDLVGYG